ncbi:hypothetical protein IFM89_001374 [Coptis chinensis]|uniref:Uncharacterized protein n=1 Tax=Coptis chinensis TaxID=261450 RepID=A0A835LP33_9MAGN|nr:hypothetical protein IFM89_001374 [Coptis chinensis]
MDDHNSTVLLIDSQEAQTKYNTSDKKPKETYIRGEAIKSIVYADLNAIVTCFSPISSISARHLSSIDVLVLGFVNLVVDGISMGFGDYMSSSTEKDMAAKERVLTRSLGNKVGEAGGSIEEQLLDNEKVGDSSSSSRVKLQSKLRAVEVEIDVVAASFEQASSRVENEEYFSGSIDNGEQEGKEDDKNDIRNATNNLNLQHALAKDRLRSLKKTKVQLQNELLELDKDEHKLIEDLVKEEVKPKRKLKEAQASKKDTKKRQKTVSYDEDVDFDAVLDAASAGFVETERDELVRKGILTPFHKLKGFERGLQQPGPSRRIVPEEEDKTDDIASATMARAVRSMSDAAQARPTTKLLDTQDLPKLDAPTHPFRRLKPPLKPPLSPDTETEKKKDKTRKHKRPLPDKKWRKAAVVCYIKFVL